MSQTLRELALKYGTDKAGHHEYCEAYEMFLKDLRDKEFSLLEIGIGGAEDRNKGGASLRMWAEYLPNAMIFGLDVHEKMFSIDRVSIHQGSQDDEAVKQYLFGIMGSPEVIIDDASHINPLTLKTFELYWPILAPGGVYVVEDVHTSYWEENYEGGDHGNTVMERFKLLTDSLNDPHSGIGDHYGIESIHFFKEIIFIRKKA